jgi:hypothetical protein
MLTTSFGAVTREQDAQQSAQQDKQTWTQALSGATAPANLFACLQGLPYQCKDGP